MKKRFIAYLMAVSMVCVTCGVAVASSQNPQQMGHPAFLESVYGKEKAKEVLKSYSAPRPYTHSGIGLLPPVDSTRDGSLAKPFVYGSTSSDAYYTGAYFTSLGILYQVYAFGTYNTYRIMNAVVCDSNGRPTTDKLTLFNL